MLTDWLLRLRSLFRRAAVEQDLEDELRFHLEQEAAKHRRLGLSSAEAVRRARLELGGVEQTKEAHRDARGIGIVDHVARELRHAARQLRRSPGFASLAIVCLGLGIGACTVLYSVVYGVALEPLPYEHSENIVRLYQVDQSGARDPFSDPNFEDIRDQTLSIETMAEFSPGTRSILAGTEALRARVAAVSSSFFDVFATSPARGRRFAADELYEGGPRVAIVSASFWKQHYSGHADLAAASFHLNGEPYTIVGVMPDGFNYPQGVEIWTAREARARNPFRTGDNWQVVARIRGGTTLPQARADATRVARRLKAQYGDDTFMSDVAMVRLQEAIVGSVRPVLLLLLAAVVLLLGIACANLASVLVARAAVRRRELAVRAALGADGFSLLLPAMTESLMIAGLGGCLGLALAFSGARFVVLIDPAILPRASEIRLSWPVLAFALATTSVTAVGLGIVASWQAGRAGTSSWLKDGTRGHTAGKGVVLFRHALVVAQLVASIVLMVGAGLLGRSLASLLSQDAGFRRSGVLTIDLSSPAPHDHPTPEGVELDDPASLPRQARLNAQLIERLRVLPGVVEAGVVNRLPLQGSGSAGTFIIVPSDEARPMKTLQDLMAWRGDAEHTGHAEFRLASGSYFRAMGIPLLRGRLFDDRDVAEAPHVGIISESLARSRWPDQDPIGLRIQFGGMDGDLRVLTIVGIVGDVKRDSLDSQPSPTFYADYRQRPLNTFNFTLVLQTAVAPSVLVPEARRVIHDIAPEVPPRFRTIDDVIGATVVSRRVTAVLTSSFAAAAALVALLGLYGVLSYLVAQRTPEFGIRMALGAQRSDVQRMVFGEAARLIVVGVALGTVAALVVSRLLKTMLFGVSAADPATYITVATALALAAFAACQVPALRATRADPARALRAE